MTTYIRANSYIEEHLSRLKNQVKNLGFTPKMQVILVGDNPASQVYVGHKAKMCEKVGAVCEIVRLPKTCTEQEFLTAVKKLNSDINIHGGIIQMPVPEQLKHLDLSQLILPFKDIDGFHIQNFKEIYNGEPDFSKTLIPCTPKGIIYLLDHNKIEISGKHVVVIGRSSIVGKPVSHLLLNRNATVTMAHSKTKDMAALCAKADIIVSAVGKEKLVTKEFTNKNQVIIDVGINKNKEGKLCGDVDFENVEAHVNAITPVPGGVGPMTVYCLIENLIIAAKKQKK